MARVECVLTSGWLLVCEGPSEQPENGSGTEGNSLVKARWRIGGDLGGCGWEAWWAGNPKAEASTEAPESRSGTEGNTCVNARWRIEGNLGGPLLLSW